MKRIGLGECALGKARGSTAQSETKLSEQRSGAGTLGGGTGEAGRSRGAPRPQGPPRRSPARATAIGTAVRRAPAHTAPPQRPATCACTPFRIHALSTVTQFFEIRITPLQRKTRHRLQLLFRKSNSAEGRRGGTCTEASPALLPALLPAQCPAILGQFRVIPIGDFCTCS